MSLGQSRTVNWTALLSGRLGIIRPYLILNLLEKHGAQRSWPRQSRGASESVQGASDVNHLNFNKFSYPDAFLSLLKTGLRLPSWTRLMGP